jgi:carbonic anhydrase
MDLIYRLDEESRSLRELPADARAARERLEEGNHQLAQQAVEDHFVVRVAGKVLGAEALGSLAYAEANMAETLRLVVVLGHSGCGWGRRTSRRTAPQLRLGSA